MKKATILSILISSLLVFNSCDRQQFSKQDFVIENSVSGLINNEPWEYKTATFSETEYLGITDFSINITDYEGSNLCDADYIDEITINVVMSKLKKGKFNIDELRKIDELNDITILDPEFREGVFDVGFSIEKGFIEIKTIKENIIEGYIEAYVDEEFQVKGNFRALRCDLF